MCDHKKQHPIEHGERSTQLKDGRFRVESWHRWKCDDCAAVLTSFVERDALASDRSIDDYWGVNYE